MNKKEKKYFQNHLEMASKKESFCEENVWDNINLIDCQIEMEKAHEDRQEVINNDLIKRILEYLSSDLGKQRMKEGRENARKKSNEFENACEIDRSELNKPFTI